MTAVRERFECIVTPRDGSIVAACRESLASINPRLARLDEPTCAALLATHRALRRAAEGGLAILDPSRVLVWTEVAHGSEPADRAFWETARGAGGTLASPMLFAATLPSAVAGEIALTFGLRGPSIVTTDADDDVPEDALAAMAGAVDIVVTVTLRGWDSSETARTTATVRRA